MRRPIIQAQIPPPQPSPRSGGEGESAAVPSCTFPPEGQAFFVADGGGSRENKPFVSRQLKMKNMKSTPLKLAKLLSRRAGGSFLRLAAICSGAAALVWFLVRVIPKPGRASYPCQRAAFPVASVIPASARPSRSRPALSYGCVAWWQSSPV